MDSIRQGESRKTKKHNILLMKTNEFLILMAKNQIIRLEGMTIGTKEMKEQQEESIKFYKEQIKYLQENDRRSRKRL